MDNTFLIGNEAISKAISVYSESQSDDDLLKIIHTIQDRIIAAGHFLIPADISDDLKDTQFNLKTLSNDDGSTFLIAFTSEEELNKGPETGKVSNFIDTFLEQVIDADSISGLVINPWGDSFTMNKTLIQLVLAEVPEHEDSYLRKNALLNKAIHFAAERHAGQLRKGTKSPYITHPMEVMSILSSMKADTNLLIAGVLHDVLEDTDTTETEILEMFGLDVHFLVTSHTEDKSKSWDERKQTAIDDLYEADPRLKLLIMADKLANLRSTYSEYIDIGYKVWDRFNAPKEKQAWYYSGIQDALYEMQFYKETEGAYWEIVSLYKDLFVEYYHDESKDILYQRCADGKTYLLNRSKPHWQLHTGGIPKKAVVKNRKDAERLEDNWIDPILAYLDRDLEYGTYKIYESQYCSTYITVINGQLCFYGTDEKRYDSGSNTLFEYTLSEDETKKFMFMLRLENGIRNRLATLLKNEFGSGDDVEFLEFCRQYSIIYEE